VPADGEWITAFDGTTVKGLRVFGPGSLKPENGALTMVPNEDMWYSATWTAYELDMEVEITSSEGATALFSVGMCQWTSGRSRNRVSVRFFPDGDIHIGSSEGDLKLCGPGTLDFKGRVRITLSIDKDNVRVQKDGSPLVSFGISNLPEKAGGFYICIYQNCNMKVRSIRAKPLRIVPAAK